MLMVWDLYMLLVAGDRIQEIHVDGRLRVPDRRQAWGYDHVDGDIFDLTGPCQVTRSM